MRVVEIGGVKALEVPADGPPLGTEQDALDLIGEAYGNEAALIVIPTARLHPDFLRLRTGMAGAFLQKIQNYDYRLALVGDISAATEASGALRDFIYESNKVGRMLFAVHAEDLRGRL